MLPAVSFKVVSLSYWLHSAFYSLSQLNFQAIPYRKRTFCGCLHQYINNSEFSLNFNFRCVSKGITGYWLRPTAALAQNRFPPGEAAHLSTLQTLWQKVPPSGEKPQLLQLSLAVGSLCMHEILTEKAEQSGDTKEASLQAAPQVTDSKHMRWMKNSWLAVRITIAWTQVTRMVVDHKKKKLNPKIQSF